MTTLREMSAEVAEVNEALGWRSVPRTWGDYVALLHSEISEALEAYRRWELGDATNWQEESLYGGIVTATGRPPKPEGVGSEAADVLIRLLDMCDAYGFPLFDMDCELADVTPVSPASGAPSTFGGWIAWLHMQASKMYEVTADVPLRGSMFQAAITLRALVAVCEKFEIDLMAEYKRKVAYNRTREFRHGGKAL